MRRPPEGPELLRILDVLLQCADSHWIPPVAHRSVEMLPNNVERRENTLPTPEFLWGGVQMTDLTRKPNAICRARLRSPMVRFT